MHEGIYPLLFLVYPPLRNYIFSYELDSYLVN